MTEKQSVCPAVSAATSARPKLAIAVVADHFSAIRRVVDCLRAQEVCNQLELVVAAPSAEKFGLPELPELARTHIVEVESVHPLPPARAAAVRAAVAPFVFVAETHSLPQPGWAAATIEAHERGAAVVVPAIGNGNPDDAISWALLIVDYGRWLALESPRELDQVPGYNTSYRRDLLLGFGARLDELLEQESGLATELGQRGERICLEPKARLNHLNISRQLPWVRDVFLVGRVVATMRLRRWSSLRRLVYLGGSPLIPFVLVWRSRRFWWRGGQSLQLPATTLLAFVAVSIVMAIGEMSGYVFPARRAELLKMTYNELHRELQLARTKALDRVGTWAKKNL